MEEPSEERLDRHFEQQLIEFDSSFKRIACKSDQILINFWMQIYRKAPKEQKLSRNCLVLLMYGHLNEFGYLQFPFTDMRNCGKDLNEVLDSYKGLPFLKRTNDTQECISSGSDIYISSEESSSVVSKNGSLTDRLKMFSTPSRASGDSNSLSYLAPCRQVTTYIPSGATSNSWITYNSHNNHSSNTEDSESKLSVVQNNTINSSAVYDDGIISSSFPKENTTSTCVLVGSGIISSSFPKDNASKTSSTYDFGINSGGFSPKSTKASSTFDTTAVSQTYHTSDMLSNFVMGIPTNACLPYGNGGSSGFAKGNIIKSSTAIDASTISRVFPTKSNQTSTISSISGISQDPVGNPVVDMFSSDFSQDQKQSTEFVSYQGRGLNLAIYVALRRLGSLRGWVTSHQIYFIRMLNVRSWYYYRRNLMRNYASLQLLQKLLERGSLSQKWQILSHRMRIAYTKCVRKVCSYAKTNRLNTTKLECLLDGMEDHYLQLTKELFYKFYQNY